MNSKEKIRKFVSGSLAALLMVCVSLLNIHIPLSLAAEAPTSVTAADKTSSAKAVKNAVASTAEPTSEDSAKDIAAQYQAAVITEKAKTPAPPATTESGSNVLLYTGIGVAAAVGIAVAAGGGGGSSSAEPEPEPEPTKPPVGADLNGTNWHGTLTLAESNVKESVTATVKQNGTELEITTSSSQEYGKKFIGTINKSAFIKAEDQDTGETWSTFYKTARWNMIDLYDFVENFHEKDRLILGREAKQPAS